MKRCGMWFRMDSTSRYPRFPLIKKRSSFSWMRRPKMKLVVISLVPNSFTIASVKHQKSYGISLRKSTKVFHPRKKLVLVLSVPNSTGSEGLVMRAANKHLIA
jgi:hypothetical protein